MGNPESYYLAPRSDEQQIMKMWMRPSGNVNSSWSSTVLAQQSPSRSEMYESKGSLKTSPQCTWNSSSTTTDSDPSSSRLSISSRASGLPEIPLINPNVSSINRQGSNSSTSDDDDFSRPYWTSIAHSDPTRKPPAANLEDVAAKSTAHIRGRSSSVTSTASRPAPARSILSSNASIKTRKGRSPPSVKFRDMPTIHYEEEEGSDELHPQTVWPGSPVTPSSPSNRKRRVFGWLSWLSQSTPAFSSKKVQSKESPAIERPAISGPMPLCEGPRARNTLPRRNTTSSSARSIRSVKSSASLRSVRSCASRLQDYWGRLGGKDP